MNITMQISQETLAQWGIGTGLVLIAYIIGYIRGQMKDWEKWRDWAAHPEMFPVRVIVSVFASLTAFLVIVASVLAVVPSPKSSDQIKQEAQFKHETLLKQMELDAYRQMKQMELDAKHPQPQQPPQPQVNESEPK